MQPEQDQDPTEIRERGKWYWVRNDLDETFSITNPAGVKYEGRLSEIYGLDRKINTLLNDMLGGLIDLQNENTSLRERIAILEGAAGSEATDLAMAASAANTAREADAAGYKMVVAELRAEISRLNGGAA